MAQDKAAWGGLFIFLLIVAAIVGEVKCVIKAIDSDWDPIGKREIIYSGAFVTGLGSIVGYLNFEDTPATPENVVVTTVQESTVTPIQTTVDTIAVDTVKVERK